MTKSTESAARDKALRLTGSKFEHLLQMGKVTDDITRVLRCGVSDSQIQATRETLK